MIMNIKWLRQDAYEQCTGLKEAGGLAAFITTFGPQLLLDIPGESSSMLQR